VASGCRIVAPGENGAFDPAASGFLPFGLGRKADSEPGLPGEPGAKSKRLIEAHSHHRLVVRVEAGCLEKRRDLVASREEIAAVMGVGYRGRRHLELRDGDSMHGHLVLASARPTHEELARGNEDAIEEIFRTC
jgi:hypothetical protein